MNVDRVGQSQLGRDASPARAEHTGPVRLVDHQPGTVLSCGRADVRERRDVAVHRKHRLGHDELSARAAMSVEHAAQVFDVVVPVDGDLSPRQPAAVDQAGVVELVADDDIAAAEAKAHRSDAVCTSSPVRGHTINAGSGG